VELEGEQAGSDGREVSGYVATSCKETLRSPASSSDSHTRQV
jgi:hypothetical protein